jgi:hypothetical protein
MRSGPRWQPAFASSVTLLACGVSASPFTIAADVPRYQSKLGSNLPIARAVEVPAGTTLIFYSGQTPKPLDPKATPGSAAYWGDTKAQTESVF